MITTQRYVDELTYEIIGCAIEVHKELGPGLIESMYEKCFVRELSLQSIDCKTQLWLPVQYKGMYLDAG